MIEIIVNVVPFGLLPPKTIAKGTIWNTGEGTAEVGEYKFILEEDEKVFKQGEVKRHVRKNNIWHLIGKALDETFGGKYE